MTDEFASLKKEVSKNVKGGKFRKVKDSLAIKIYNYQKKHNLSFADLAKALGLKCHRQVFGPIRRAKKILEKQPKKELKEVKVLRLPEPKSASAGEIEITSPSGYKINFASVEDAVKFMTVMEKKFATV